MKTRTIIVIIIVLLILAAIWFYIVKSGPGFVEKGSAQFRSLTKTGTCDVCYYAKGDSTKHDVTYCPTCDAWMCESCQPNIPLRAIAMANRKLSNI